MLFRSIKVIVNPKNIIDSSEIVTKELEKALKKNNLINENKTSGNITIYNSKEDQLYNQRCYEILRN